MANDSQFFDLQSFLLRMVRGDLKASSAALAAYRTASMFGHSTRTYWRLRAESATEKGRDPLLGPMTMTRWCNELLERMGIERLISGSDPREFREIEGYRGLPRATLVVSNHRSYLDVLVIGSLLPAFMVGSAMVKGWPVIGPGGELAGILYVERSSRKSRKFTRNLVLDKLEAGFSVLNFPEGANFNGRGMAPFKPGMFHVVPGMDVDILPITLRYPENSGIEWVGDKPEDLSEGRVSDADGRISLIEHVIELLTGPPVSVSVHFGERVNCLEYSDAMPLLEEVRARMERDLDRPAPL